MDADVDANVDVHAGNDAESNSKVAKCVTSADQRKEKSVLNADTYQILTSKDQTKEKPTEKCVTPGNRYAEKSILCVTLASRYTQKSIFHSIAKKCVMPAKRYTEKSIFFAVEKKCVIFEVDENDF